MDLSNRWPTLFLVHLLSSIIASTSAEGCPASSAAPIVLSLANATVYSQDAFTYGVKINVGHPKQSVCLTPSTFVDNTQLISTDICASAQPNLTQAQCRSYHGGTFDLGTAGASFYNISITSANLPADLGWTKFNDRYHVAGEIDLDLVSNVLVPNMTVVVITEGKNFTTGHMGLGKASSLLQHLKDAAIIPTFGFGLNAGSRSVKSPRDGSLVLGGFDSASLKGPWYSYPMNYSDTLAGRHCPLQIQIQELQLVFDGQEPIPLLEPGDAHAACIEPYDNLFRLSNIGLTSFQHQTNWSSTTAYDSDALFLPEPGLLYPSTTGFNGSLKYLLSSGQTVVIPNHELQHPLRGLDKAGNYALQPDFTEVNVFNQPLGAWVLGKVFLSQVYLAVDYEAEVIYLADINLNSGSTSPARFPSTKADCSHTPLSRATIAAIVLGVVIGLALLVGAGYLLYRRRKAPQEDATSAPQATESMTETVGFQQLSSTETSTTHDNQLHLWEMSGERRTSELPSPNGGYPPPSPHEITSQTTAWPTAYVPLSGDVGPPTQQYPSNQPWSQQNIPQ